MVDTAAHPPGTRRRLERLIVTRPAPEAHAWVDALRAEGWPAQALPLIEIAPPAAEADQATLRHWRAHWTQADAILFVSGAAVSHFFEGGVAPASQPPHTRFWAPGPGTARLLEQALKPLGLGAAHIDAPPPDAAQFDSEHLWPVVSSQVGPGRQVLIVRGTSAQGTSEAGVAGTGRDWLIRQCTAAGAQVQGCVAYARRAPVLSATDRAVIEAAATAHGVWLFSSSEALLPLQQLQPAPVWAPASALVTHPRIAAAAAQAGFGQICQTRPALADVVRALESGWTRP
ncbi:uroporphyrinogen-III synthase [Hydrogenophaga sp.]|uniref:uroporphyrinogen-III synthase n=1 Tax=Hydrogenophaga sp. TaxID=1904254 RepID=UPI0025B8D704|nr:uroporphyrinogen-III synthase [Hydrogenophaga sp.]